jgi:hypothetical protein
MTEEIGLPAPSADGASLPKLPDQSVLCSVNPMNLNSGMENEQPQATMRLETNTAGSEVSPSVQATTAATERYGTPAEGPSANHPQHDTHNDGRSVSSTSNQSSGVSAGHESHSPGETMGQCKGNCHPVFTSRS